MKASLKFREEKNPLLRAKLPFNAGALPLVSGVAVGNSQELAVHVGTFLPAGPAIKLALKPNGPSPLSVMLKAGLGRWGSPNGAPITLKAEFYIAPKGGDPVFTLQVKPRLGDFSFQKNLDCAKFTCAQQKVADGTLAPSPVSAATENLIISSPPPANGDTRALPKRNSGNLSDKDRMRSPSVDSNAVVIGSNFSLKIEGLDREWKGRNDKRAKVEGAKDHENEGIATGNGNGNLVHALNDDIQELANHDMKGRSLGAFSFAGARRSFQGCRFVALSSLPLGKQTWLHVRWGVKPPLDSLQVWDGSLPPLSFSKLPSLLLDKISFEQAAMHPMEKARAVGLQNGNLEAGLLPAQFLEENRELAQVAALCHNMKRQLHLLYAENQVLRRSMEDMKSQVEFRGFRSTASGSEDGIFMKEQVFSRGAVNPEGPRAMYNGREGSPWEAEARKGPKDVVRKDMDTDVRSTHSLNANADMSKELEKAIKSSKSVTSSGK